MVVQVWPDRVLPIRGHLGYAPMAGMIQLTFDPACPAFEPSLGAPLARTVLHEAHHCARWAGPGYGATLGERLVSEGLAYRFAREISGVTEPWEEAVPPPEMDDWTTRATRDWDAPARAWDGEHAWTTYSVGSWIVGRALERMGETAAGAARRPAEDFRYG